MALTGLFLCLFLVGHLLGNLQLILIQGIEGKRAFNEYAYFMGHNPLIKVMSYLTYISVLFHVIDGIALTIQNKKARPQAYAYSNPSANSSLPSRYMALLGSLILIFLILHMSHFWWTMKMSSKAMPLHTEKIYFPLTQNPEGEDAYYTTNGNLMATSSFDVKNGTELYIKDFSEQMLAQDPTFKMKGQNPKYAEGYKDLHSLVFAFFGHDKAKEGFPKNDHAPIGVIIYTLAMLALAFHLWHGFASAFQSLGINHKKYNPIIKGFGKAFAVLIPLAFAVIPIIIYLTK